MAKKLVLMALLALTIVAAVHGKCSKENNKECRDAAIEISSDDLSCGKDRCLYYDDGDDTCAKMVTVPMFLATFYILQGFFTH